MMFRLLFALYITSVLYVLNPLNSNTYKSGTVHYKVSFDTSSIEEDTKPKAMIIKASEMLGLLSYKLSFNQRESMFGLENRLTSDNDDNVYYRMAKKLGGDAEIYTDLSQKYVLTKKEFINDIFVISDSLDYSWTIKSETKTINGFLCYKAEIINQESYLHPKGRHITAWFTNEIPFNFGPKGYSGLPGLILELSENKISYIIKEIKLEKTDLKITPPSGGIKITKQKFEEYVRKKVKEFKFE